MALIGVVLYVEFDKKSALRGSTLATLYNYSYSLYIYNILTFKALLKYVEYIQNAVYAPNSLKITFQCPDQTTMIGKQTLFKYN